MDGHVIVLDVGKTLSKLTVWTREGEQVERLTRPNEVVRSGDYRALDAEGIGDWLGNALSDLARRWDIDAIIPVAHGAACAIVRDGALACPPLDYEQAIPPEFREFYDHARDPFAATGSPALPDALNLGAGLAWLEHLHPELLERDATILPWPQYWAWALSGVAACEVTSLGCHSDLLLPSDLSSSALARRCGWAGRLPRMRRASDVLGTLTEKWVLRTGLGRDVAVYCGVHDSNAALVAARGLPELHGQEMTMVSTGTWFIAMRTPGSGASFEITALDEARDCLVNIDVDGRMVPSARWMGGREIELLTGIDSRRIDIKPDQGAILAALPELLNSGAMLLPTFAKGCGPFPEDQGQWANEPSDPLVRRAAVSLYAALVTDASLDLIGARERILIEGRFAEAELFVRALAALRPDDQLYTALAHNDVSFGALRIVVPELATPSALKSVLPLVADLIGYRERWRAAINQKTAGGTE